MNENNAIEQIYPLCEQDYNFENEKEIKELLSPYKDGSIGIAQLNPIVGNLEYNAKKIIKYIKHAQSVGLDFVVFPELALVGYPFGNLLDRYPNFADENIAYVCGATAYVNADENITADSETTYWDLDSKCRDIEGRIQTITAGDGKAIQIRCVYLLPPSRAGQADRRQAAETAGDLYAAKGCCQAGKPAESAAPREPGRLTAPGRLAASAEAHSSAPALDSVLSAFPDDSCSAAAAVAPVWASPLALPAFPMLFTGVAPDAASACCFPSAFEPATVPPF